MMTTYWTDFTHRKDGATAIIFALALLPVIVMIGFAMDIQRANAIKLHLQTAADSAALAGARQYYDGGETAASVAETYFVQSVSTMSHGAVCSAPNVCLLYTSPSPRDS